MKKLISNRFNRRELGASRLSVGIVSLGSGLALLLTPIGAGGQTVDANATASAITITQTPSGVVADCVDPAVAVLNGTLKAFPASDATTFKLVINAAAPLCGNGITAKAVVYGMPTEGEWPQTLKETKEFTITEAGDTTITFAKACDRVQYDVLTGDTPQVIYSGLEHGPLLFPANLETAFQHVGNGEGCNNASTTIAPTTTAVVQGSTTIQTTTTVRSAVLAATTIPGTGVSSEGSTLAATGITTGPFALMGGGLVLLGMASLLAARRRHA